MFCKQFLYLWKSAFSSHFVRTRLLSLGFLTGYSHTEPLERSPPLPEGCAHGLLCPMWVFSTEYCQVPEQERCCPWPRVSLDTVLCSFPHPSSVDYFWPAATAHPSSDFSQLHCEARQPLGHSLVHLHVSSTALPLGGRLFQRGGGGVPGGGPSAPAPALPRLPGCSSTSTGGH